jgi:membrane-associated phospholipid phosphatase
MAEAVGGPAERAPAAGPLAVDYLLAAYLAATGVLAALSGGGGAVVAVVHGVALAVLSRLARLPLPSGAVLQFFRMVYPLALTPLLYLELATLNQLHVTGYFDQVVQNWEEWLFGVQLSVVAAERFRLLWLSEMLHLGYFSYYFLIPAACIGAYVVRGPRALERVAFTTALAFFVCYLCFAVFPVAGPRYDFPTITGPPSDGFLFALVHQILEGGSSKGTAFPSSHVAATVSAWLAAGRETRRVFWIMAPFAVSLTVGTVYGRFHYGIDATAGLLIAAAAFAVTPWLMGRLEDGPADVVRVG